MTPPPPVDGASRQVDVTLAPISTEPLDLARLIAAVLLPLLALAFPWDGYGNAAGNVWALVAILIALGGAAVPFVLAPKPDATTAQIKQYNLIRLVPLAPLALVAAIAIIRDLSSIRGVGFAVPLAVLGAVLGASHQGTPRAPVQPALWSKVAAVASLTAAAFGVLWVIRALTNGMPFFALFVTFAVMSLAVAGVAAWIGMGLWRGASSSWLILLCVGGALFVAGLWNAFAGSGGSTLGQDHTFLFVSLAAACAPGVVHTVQPAPRGAHDVLSLVSSALLVMTALGGALALASVFTLASSYTSKGTSIWLVVYFAATAVTAWLVRGRLTAGHPQARGYAALWALAVAVLGFLNAVALAKDNTMIVLAVSLFLPLILLALLGLPVVNRERGALSTALTGVFGQTGTQDAQGAATGMPAPPAGPPAGQPPVQPPTAQPPSQS